MRLASDQHNLFKDYFDTLPSDSVHRKYYEGLKYESKNGLIAHLKNIWNLPKNYNEILRFYPYQKLVKASVKEFEEDEKKAFNSGIFTTGFLWAAIFYAGRNGYVLPLLKEYGRIFKSHRIFRHYLLALVLPYSYFWYSARKSHINNYETIMSIHVNRLNNKIIEDPEFTIYPLKLQTQRRIDYKV